MKSTIYGALVAVAAAMPLSSLAADITLNPSLGQQDEFKFAVCDSDEATVTIPDCPAPGSLTGPTNFTVEFLSTGLLNSSGSTSRSPTTAGSFSVFNYVIRDPSNTQVATGTPQNPLDLVVGIGTYTVTVNWTLLSTALQSANWQIVLTTSRLPERVPEPATLALLGLGLAGLGFARRRKS